LLAEPSNLPDGAAASEVPSASPSEPTLLPHSKAGLWQGKWWGRLVGFISLSGLRGVDTALGLIKDIVLTRLLGLGAFLDAYFVTLGLLDVASGFFQQMGYGVLLPLFNEKNSAQATQDQNTQAQQTLVIVFGNYLTLAVLLVAIGEIILSTQIGTWLAPTLQANPNSHLDILLTLLLPLSLLCQSAYALRLLLIQYKRFAWYHWPAIGSTIAFLLMVWGLFPTLGLWAVIWAFPISQVLQLIGYLWALQIPWRWTWHYPELGRMMRYAAPNLAICLVYYLFIPVDNWFLAQLPPGELSAYRYAAKLVTTMGTLTVFSLQMTLIPNLMSAGGQQDSPTMQKLMRQGLLESVLVSLPVIGLGIWLGPWLVKLVFLRGEFTETNARNLTQCFQILVWQLPYIGSWMLVSRAFNSRFWLKPFLVLGVIALSLRIGLDAIGWRWAGMAGIAWMTTLQYYLMLALGWLWVGRRLHRSI
jgi:putative peptidoglycan lipid II flippase